MAKASSGNQIAARKRARERAAGFREREATLEGFAIEYFTAADTIEAIDAELEIAIQKLRDKAAESGRAARAAADAAIVSMAGEGTPASEIAERLDTPVGIVRAAIRAAKGAEGTAESDEAATGEDSDGARDDAEQSAA